MICFFDTETNGLNGNRDSLLSICMVLARPIFRDDVLTLDEVDVFKRFYFPTEPYNTRATNVNGLTQSVLEQHRRGQDWPDHFCQDKKSVLKFVEPAGRFVAHNISFDRNFVPFDASPGFCTMHNLTDICRIDHYYGYKWPKLSEAVDILNVNIDDLGDNYHDAEFDVRCTMRLFEKCYLLDKLRNDVVKFCLK